MKITDPQVIRQGEEDLIASVQEDLDLDAIREILKERMSVAALTSRGGQIVVHNNEIAFRLDFEINLSGSLLFDRDGNFIDRAPEGESGIPSPLIRDREEGTDLDDGEDDLSVDLPDYGLDQGPDLYSEEDADPETGLDLDEELALAAEELADDLEEEDPELLDDEEIDLEGDEASDHEFEDILKEDEEPSFDDDDTDADLDDDINDILKESREFWEQKKES